MLQTFVTRKNFSARHCYNIGNTYGASDIKNGTNR